MTSSILIPQLHQLQWISYMVVSGSCLFSYSLIIFIKLPNQSIGMFAKLWKVTPLGDHGFSFTVLSTVLKLKAELRVVFYQTLKGSHDFPQMFLWMILIKNKSTVRRYSSTIVVSLRMWVFLTSFLTAISKREIISKIKHWELQKQPVTKPSFLGTQAIFFVCVYSNNEPSSWNSGLFIIAGISCNTYLVPCFKLAVACIYSVSLLCSNLQLPSGFLCVKSKRILLQPFEFPESPEQLVSVIRSRWASGASG